MKNISNNTIWVGVISLVVGLILGWVMGYNSLGAKAVSKVSGTGEKNNALENAAVVEEKTGSALGANSSVSENSDSTIIVGDQGAGSVVTVASVETDASVWVVVREDKNGIIGNILGATRVDAGNSNNVTINLLRPTLAGQTYQVVLFKDDGDRMFDHKVDAPLTSGDTLIAAPFAALAQ